MNLLKKLAEDWKTEAKGPTLSMHKRAAEAYVRCATELEAMVGAVEALAKFRKGNGTGLPFGTIAWVMADGRRYIREWHPLHPSGDGTPQGNWWPLEPNLGMSGRFSEHEVSHYSVIEVPEQPAGMGPSPAPRRHPSEVELTAVVGKVGAQYMAWTMLADLNREVMSEQGFERGLPVVVQYRAPSEKEALDGLRDRAKDVLNTFFESYKVVRL